MADRVRAAYPMSVTGLNGPRWKTSDGATHANKALADAEQARLGPGPMISVGGWRSPYEDRAFPLGLGMAAVALLGMLATVGWQLATWLRAGIWPSDGVLDLLAVAPAARPHAEWVGADRVLQTIISPPLSLLLLGVAVLIVHMLTRDDVQQKRPSH